MNSRTRKKLRSRKYGGAIHKGARREFESLVNAGFARCARCGGHIAPGSMWDVGHDDRYPWLISGPEHAGCNRGAPHRNVTSVEWS